MRGQEESLGGKMSEEITRNRPWVLQTDVVGYEVNRKVYSNAD